MSSAGRAVIATFPTTLAVVGTLVALTGVIDVPRARAAAQEVAVRVGIEFLSDGRCEVSAEGDGLRSRATYMPAAGPRPAELRCAMPPVVRGQTVALTVSLPTGMPRPGTGVPPLAWVEVQGRWIGTAQMTDWPDVVVVPAAGSWLAAGNLATAATAVVFLIVGMTLARYTRRSRHLKPPG